MDQRSDQQLDRITDTNEEGVDPVGYAAGASDTYMTTRVGDYPSDDDVRQTSAADTGDVDATDEAAEPEQLKAQIEETRSHMSDTIDAIQEKLSLQNITEQVKENVSETINSAIGTAQTAVYDATIGKAENFMQSMGKSVSRGLSDVSESLGGSGSYVVKTARRNPLPLALIGLGVGMLLMQRNKSRSRRRSVNYDYDRDTEIRGSSSYSTGRQYSAGRGTGRGGEYSRESGGGQSMMNRASETVSDALSSASGTASNAASSAYETVSGAASRTYEGAGDIGTYIARTAKNNPLPLALMGLSLAMMAYNSNSGSSSYDYRRTQRIYGDNEGTGQTTGSSADRGDSTLQQASETASNTANSAYQGVSNAASSAYQGFTSLASTTRDSVGSIGTQARNVASQGYSQYEQALSSNPLAVGATAMALGAVVGMAIPSSRYENQLMGETKENLVQSVEGVARDAFDRAQQVAGEVTRTVKEQVQNQDVTQ